MAWFQMAATALLIVLAAGSSMDAAASASSSLRFDASAAKNRPISKVVTLMKDMLKQMEKDAEIDEEVYEKFICWCTVNDAEKTKAIKDAEEKIKMLGLQIDEWTAFSGQLSVQISGHYKDMKNLKENLAKATAIRKKELAEFNAHEQELLDTIAALKKAIATLGKHHGALLQQSVSSQLTLLQQVVRKHDNLVKNALTHRQHHVLVSFLQRDADDAFLQQPPGESYAPQSGEILGILKQMLEEFEKDLATAQKDEIAAQTEFEELKASIMEELSPTIEVCGKKEGEKADTDDKTDAAKKDKEDTEAELEANKEYLDKVREKCRLIDLQYEARQKTRQLEMEAVNKAMSILTSDEAMDLGSRTFNSASFLQTETAELRQKQYKASRLLQAAAEKVHSPRLSAFAMRVRLDAFTKVKQAIDDMISALVKEKEDEIKHKDFCVDELNQNQLQTEKKDREKTDLETLIDDLKMTIAKLTKEIAELEAEISETQVNLKRAGEDRDAEAREFQQTVADQRATQKLLSAAMAVLKGFYDKEHEVHDLHKSLLQKPAGPPPPPDFADYAPQPSGGVMGMMAMIIKDAKAMEAEAVKDEEEATATYGTFVEEANKSIESMKASIVDKKEKKAETEEALAEAEENLDKVVEELAGLATYNDELHAACDFTLKNFEKRQTARDGEIEALKQAKAILSGAKFEAFLQRLS